MILVHPPSVIPGLRAAENTEPARGRDASCGDGTASTRPFVPVVGSGFGCAAPK